MSQEFNISHLIDSRKDFQSFFAETQPFWNNIEQLLESLNNIQNTLAEQAKSSINELLPPARQELISKLQTIQKHITPFTQKNKSSLHDARLDKNTPLLFLLDTTTFQASVRFLHICYTQRKQYENLEMGQQKEYSLKIKRACVTFEQGLTTTYETIYSLLETLKEIA